MRKTSNLQIPVSGFTGVTFFRGDDKVLCTQHEERFIPKKKPGGKPGCGFESEFD